MKISPVQFRKMDPDVLFQGPFRSYFLFLYDCLVKTHVLNILDRVRPRWMNVIRGCIGYASCTNTCLIFVFATSCASTDYEERIKVVESEMRDLFAVEGEVVEYNAIPLAVPQGVPPEDFEQVQWTPLQSTCLEPYHANVLLAINESSEAILAGERLQAIEYLVQQTANLDSRLSDCGKKLGVDVQYKLVLSNNKELGVSQLFNELHPLVTRYERLIEEENRRQMEAQRFWSGIGSALGTYARSPRTGVNPSQLWINPYYRSDGTLVNSHWRTTPNGLCLDNIRSC